MLRGRILKTWIFLSLSFIHSLALADTRMTDQALWSALRSDNHFSLIRHALAPGTGDPGNFALGRRDTQRNLSEQGRQQAEYIGELFRAQGIEEASVYSSEWFRCMDTAELLGLGPVTPLPALNSFFQDYGQKDATTESLRLWLSRREFDKPLILVTHQVNITALTGVYPESGEIVVVEQDAQAGLRVLGRIKTLR